MRYSTDMYDDENYLGTRGFHLEEGYYRYGGKEYSRRWEYRERSEVATRKGITIELVFYVYQDTEKGTFAAEIRFSPTSGNMNYTRDDNPEFTNTWPLLSYLDTLTMDINALCGTTFKHNTLEEIKNEADAMRAQDRAEAETQE